MHERLNAQSAPSAAAPGRCGCGGKVGPTGECSACRAKRLAGRSESGVSPQGPGRAPPAFRFGDLNVHPQKAAPAPPPQIRVREFATAGPHPGSDKSVREESELQDQNANVSSYTTTANGVRMVVDAQNVGPRPQYPDGFKWTQTIDTNVPLGGATSPYVDPRPNDDAKPFYWTDAEHAASPTQFRDSPSRPAPGAGTTTWDATLCLNGVNEATQTVTTFDCITYGFSRDSAGAVTRQSVGSSWGIGHRRTLASEFPAWRFTTVGHPGTGAIVGGLAGAGIGFLVGGPLGALIGGAIGALGGAILGSFF